MEDRDRYWLAGWLEGEGCFHLGARRDGRPRFHIEAASTDLDTLQRAQRITGVGSIRERDKPTGKPIWVWQVTAREPVLSLVRELQPLMGARRRARMQELLDAAAAHPPIEPTHEERSRRAHKMWETRRQRYGPTGART